MRSTEASCVACAERGLTCEVDKATDKRRSEYRGQHRQDHLLLDQLIVALRHNDTSNGLIDLIRSDAPKAQITDYLEQSKHSKSSELDMLLTSPVDVNETQQSSSSSVEASQQQSTNISPSLTSLSKELVGVILKQSFRTETSTSPGDRSEPQNGHQSQEGSVAELEDRSTSGVTQSQPASATSEVCITPGAVRSFGNLAMSDAILANQYPPAVQARQLSVIHGTIETCLPINLDIQTSGVASLAASAVASFRDAARNQIAQGVPARNVLSMDGFELDLFYRDRTSDDPHNLAGWAAEWGKAWTHMPMEVRFAAVHYIGTLVRWLIMPCKETYRLMSPLVRPLLSQLMMPHTMDVDLWGAPPLMRELQLLRGGGWLNSVSPNTQRLHWPHGPDKCTEERLVPSTADVPGALDDGQGGYVRTAVCLSPSFIAFIDQEESWTIHRDLLQLLPELEGRTEFHDD